MKMRIKFAVPCICLCLCFNSVFTLVSHWIPTSRASLLIQYNVFISPDVYIRVVAIIPLDWYQVSPAPPTDTPPPHLPTFPYFALLRLSFSFHQRQWPVYPAVLGKCQVLSAPSPHPFTQKLPGLVAWYPSCSLCICAHSMVQLPLWDRVPRPTCIQCSLQGLTQAGGHVFGHLFWSYWRALKSLLSEQAGGLNQGLWSPGLTFHTVKHPPNIPFTCLM